MAKAISMIEDSSIGFMTEPKNELEVKTRLLEADNVTISDCHLEELPDGSFAVLGRRVSTAGHQVRTKIERGSRQIKELRSKLEFIFGNLSPAEQTKFKQFVANL